MSKSLGNYIGVSEPPDTIFGKLMSISDTLMFRYYELEGQAVRRCPVCIVGLEGRV